MSDRRGHDAARKMFDEALDIIGGDRNASYGHPSVNFHAQAQALSGILTGYFGEPMEVPARLVPLIYQAWKICREAHCEDPDNQRDIAGFAGTAVMEREVRG